VTRSRGSLRDLEVWLAERTPGQRSACMLWACARAVESGYSTDSLVRIAVETLGLDPHKARKLAEQAASLARRG
jgi:hypothetical protein